MSVTDQPVPDTGKIIMNQAELYRMNCSSVPGFLVLILFFTCMMPVSAGTGQANLTITSVKEEGGYIVTSVTSGEAGGLEAGYLTYWLNTAPGGCSTSHLLGWQYLPPETPLPAVMKGPVPYGITPGTYEVQVHYGQGTKIPDGCDTGVVASTTVVVSTPGSGTHDMTGTLDGGSGVDSGPDYRIDAITGIDTAVRMTPSSTMTPSVTVSNGGKDDQSDQPVEVHAYLGSEELIPVKATIIPMKAGESRNVPLSYIIPGAISQRSYPFFMIIDPRGIAGTADAATNLKRTGGQMMVRAEEIDPLAGHGCGCK